MRIELYCFPSRNYGLKRGPEESISTKDYKISDWVESYSKTTFDFSITFSSIIIFAKKGRKPMLLKTSNGTRHQRNNS